MTRYRGNANRNGSRIRGRGELPWRRAAVWLLSERIQPVRSAGGLLSHSSVLKIGPYDPPKSGALSKLHGAGTLKPVIFIVPAVTASTPSFMYVYIYRTSVETWRRGDWESPRNCSVVQLDEFAEPLSPPLATSRLGAVSTTFNTVSPYFPRTRAPQTQRHVTSPC